MVIAFFNAHVQTPAVVSCCILLVVVLQTSLFEVGACASPSQFLAYRPRENVAESHDGVFDVPGKEGGMEGGLCEKYADAENFNHDPYQNQLCAT